MPHKCSIPSAQFVRLCDCGCGQPTKVAQRTDAAHDALRGQPNRFIRNHHGRGVMGKRTPAIDRALLKIAISDEPNACWIWCGATDTHGYARMTLPKDPPTRRGKFVLVSHVTWGHLHGVVPSGMCLCHRCDTPLCVNPDHLFLGTRADNNADMVAKGRQVRGDAHWTRKRQRGDYQH